jgi:hypothetical protein
MDITTIVIIVVVAAILIFLWPRIGARRGGPTNLNPPANVPGQGQDIVSNDRDSRIGVTPQTDRPHGQPMPTNADSDDIVDEAMDDVKSPNPNKSL